MERCYDLHGKPKANTSNQAMYSTDTPATPQQEGSDPTKSAASTSNSVTLAQEEYNT